MKTEEFEQIVKARLSKTESTLCQIVKKTADR